MTTFVLIIFFWEPTRGYAITHVPGYDTRAACEQAASEVKSPSTSSYTLARAICVTGPKH